MGAILEFYFVPVERRLPEATSASLPADLWQSGAIVGSGNDLKSAFDRRNETPLPHEAMLALAHWLNRIGEFKDGLSINSNRIVDFELALTARGLEQLLWNPFVHAKAQNRPTFGWVENTELEMLIARIGDTTPVPELESIADWINDAIWERKSIATRWV
jgi:hypothetical protein